MRLEQRRALRIAAAVMFVIAYWYTKGILSSKNWERGSWQPLLVAAAFLALATWLAKCLQGGEQVPEKRSDRRETLLLGTCLFLQSLAFGLYPVHEDLIGIFQVLLWHGTAIFFVLSLAGMLADHRLGLLFPADAANGAFRIPFQNLFLRGKLLWGRREETERSSGAAAQKTVILLLTGVAALVLALFAAAELSAASTSFAAIGDRIGLFFDGFSLRWLTQDFLPYFILSLPVGAYLFGLLGGSLLENPKVLTGENWRRKTARLRAFPERSLLVVLGALAVVYAAFFALAGGWSGIFDLQGISAWDACKSAVAGFWQLVRVMLLNFLVLLASFVFGKEPAWAQKRARILAAVLLVFSCLRPWLWIPRLLEALCDLHRRLWPNAPPHLCGLGASCPSLLGCPGACASQKELPRCRHRPPGSPGLLYGACPRPDRDALPVRRSGHRRAAANHSGIDNGDSKRQRKKTPPAGAGGVFLPR